MTSLISRTFLIAVVACGGGGKSPEGAACGPVTCGAGTVCCDHCTGSCVPEESGAACPDDIDPNRTCNPQVCGSSSSCNVDTEVCVGNGPIGPSVQHACQPVPSGCENDRTCDCLAASLCPPNTAACSNVATNEIFCDNGTQ
ncbi:MAG: hypothetical protein ACKV2T_05980 [Kofleriaceae bacterium]